MGSSVNVSPLMNVEAEARGQSSVQAKCLRARCRPSGMHYPEPSSMAKIRRILFFKDKLILQQTYWLQQ